MAINYKPVKKVNPFNTDNPVKYYSSPVYKDRVSLRKIAKEISERTTLSTTDTLAVLEAMTQVLPFFLTNGSIVNLGDFGTFRITLQSRGADIPGELTPSHNTGFKLLFRPGKEMTDQLKQIETRKIDD